MWTPVFFLFLTPVLLVPVTSLAETVRLRSGEHEDFTRLVLPMPSETDWKIEKRGDEVLVHFSRSDLEVDTSGVFSRIPRTRVRDVSQDGSGAPLVFRLACDCSFDSFVHSDNWLVMDVREDRDNPFVARPAIGRKIQIPGAIPELWPNWPMFEIGEIAGVKQPAYEVDQMAIAPDHFESRLNEQLKRAARQGLISIRDGRETTLVVPTPELPLNPPKASSLPPETGSTGSPSVSMSVATSVDRDHPGKYPLSIKSDDHGPNCLPDRLVNVPKWGTAQPFSEQISEKRSILADDLGQIVPESALAMARLSIFFGLGAEARRILHVSSAPEAERDVLTGLSAIMDGEPLTQGNPFLGQENCDGNVALWAVLATAEIPPSDKVNEQAVLQAFSRLPEHLRLNLATALGTRMAESGHTGGSEQVLRIVQRSMQEPLSQIDILDARLAIASGDSDRAKAPLDRLSSLDTGETPEALIAIVELHWKEKKAPGPDLSTSIAAFEVEHRRSQLGPDLRRAHSLALALAGDPDAAFRSALDVKKLDGEEAYHQLVSALLDQLAVQGDGLTFLRHAVGFMGADSTKLSPSTRLSMGERLVALHLPEPAMHLLSDFEPENAPRDGDRVARLRAEAQLALGRPHRALLELVSVSGADADILRGRALLAVGENDAAAQRFDQAGDRESVSRALWASGELERLIEVGEGRFARAADLAKDISGDNDTAPSTPLAEAEWLLSRSTVLRDNVDALFSAVETEEQSSSGL